MTCHNPHRCERLWSILVRLRRLHGMSQSASLRASMEQSYFSLRRLPPSQSASLRASMEPLSGIRTRPNSRRKDRNHDPLASISPARVSNRTDIASPPCAYQANSNRCGSCVEPHDEGRFVRDAPRSRSRCQQSGRRQPLSRSAGDGYVEPDAHREGGDPSEQAQENAAPGGPPRPPNRGTRRSSFTYSGNERTTSHAYRRTG